MFDSEIDVFQERYLSHQKRKKLQLIELVKKRYSERIFSNKVIDDDKLNLILSAKEHAPSSCDRQAVDIVVIESRDDKQLLSGLLVGGVGWIHRASHILMLFAHPAAYKENLSYMPYLDAGFLANTIYLICADLEIGCCFVNPNVRDSHYLCFNPRFNKEGRIFCGVCAIGYKDDY